MRLTDEQLELIAETARRARDQHRTMASVIAKDVLVMVTEIRQRRAADLTAEEQEALVYARMVVDPPAHYEYRTDPLVDEHMKRCRAALAALDRLLGQGGGK